MKKSEPTSWKQLALCCNVSFMKCRSLLSTRILLFSNLFTINKKEFSILFLNDFMRIFTIKYEGWGLGHGNYFSLHF